MIIYKIAIMNTYPKHFGLLNPSHFTFLSLQSYVAVGMVSIDDISDVLAYDAWMRAQNMFVNDCVYRFAYESKWVMVGDFDEYFYIKVRVWATWNEYFAKVDSELSEKVLNFSFILEVYRAF